MLRLQEFHGAEIEPHLDALGALRITVFREYPYLYEGSLQYEREYLRTYAGSERSLVVLVLDGEDVVGATTCLPMTDEGPEFQKPFVDGGRDLETICYFGESILLPQYRGQGLGKEFFRRREAHAKRQGFGLTTFCAVNRTEDHPLRPLGYRGLDSFWQSLGYTRDASLQAEFYWKEIGEESESPKSLTFWTKPCPKT
jgi:GNAT superfamily N-acetyltransferase